MIPLGELGEFDSVFDVGSNLGDFSEQARQVWPDAAVTSFEPLPFLAAAQRDRAKGRWWVEPVAISEHQGEAVIHFCENQHSASTLQQPGTARAGLGIRDRFSDITVKTAPLDDYLRYADGRLLVKVDVEGHERGVLAGGLGVFNFAHTVVIEVQNDPTIFLDSPSPLWVDTMLRTAFGLRFVGLADAFQVGGRVLQYDAIYRR